MRGSRNYVSIPTLIDTSEVCKSCKGEKDPDGVPCFLCNDLGHHCLGIIVEKVWTPKTDDEHQFSDEEIAHALRYFESHCIADRKLMMSYDYPNQPFSVCQLEKMVTFDGEITELGLEFLERVKEPLTSETATEHITT